MIFIQDRFTIERDGYILQDAIVLPENEYNLLSQSDIDSLKQKRFENYLYILGNTITPDSTQDHISVWKGLGVNYKSFNPKMNEWDAKYFKAIGLKNIRIHIPGYTSTPAQLLPFETTAKYFHDQGFYVVYGLTCGSGAITQTTFKNSYIPTVVAYAKKCNDSLICDEFQIGNEETLHNDSSYAPNIMINDILSLATQTKVNFKGIVSYSAEGTLNGDARGSNGFKLHGDTGELDLLSINVYGNVIRTSGKVSGITPTYTSVVNNILSVWPIGRLHVSEFNVEAGNTNFNDIPDSILTPELQSEYTFLRSNNILKTYLYQYCPSGDNQTGDSFWLAFSDRIKYQKGNFRPAWKGLLG